MEEEKEVEAVAVDTTEETDTSSKEDTIIGMLTELQTLFISMQETIANMAPIEAAAEEPVAEEGEEQPPTEEGEEQPAPEDSEKETEELDNFLNDN